MTNMLGKLDARIDAVDSLLCVGLDSNAARLPARFMTGSADDAQFAFNRWIIDQTHPYVCAYKPNLAFYEARGQAGLAALARTLDYLRAEHPDIVTIGDAKRADIGSTNQGYVSALFDALGLDAVTLNPYLGREALAPFLARAEKGCIILCRTSNPGAGEFQDLQVAGRPLWEIVAEQVATTWNEHGNCLLVAGATYPAEMARIRALTGNMTLLVPGVGAQGGNAAQAVRAGLNRQGRGLIINSSRGVIFADDPAAAAQRVRDEINAARRALP